MFYWILTLLINSLYQNDFPALLWSPTKREKRTVNNKILEIPVLRSIKVCRKLWCLNMIFFFWIMVAEANYTEEKNI